MTALSIAQRLGYISVVEELKVVTETTIASKHELITEERYKVNIHRNICRSFKFSFHLDSSTRSVT
jgi:ankyrin